MNSEIADSFISHLIELRTRLLRALIAILVVFVCLFPFAKEIYALLAQPMLASLPAGGQMIATDVTTPFFVPMKVTMMAAFLIALPYVLYQAWAFVAPGLYTHEKRLAVPLIAASTFLFMCGMAFAYFLVFPVVFGFVASVAPDGVAVMTDIDKYLNFVLTLFMAFGITFEVPIVVILLVKMNMVSIEKLKEVRPYVVVGAFILGAIFTPPDVVSQIMLAVPLWLLYELGIIIASIITRPQPEKTVHALSEEELKQELREFEALEQEATKKDL
jgi:sec-independent protein translocase protein TatC